MAENYALTGFKEIGRDIGQFCANNKAHIFTGLSVAGTIATGVLSARSGARSARKIDKKEAELGRRLTPGEKMKLCGKDFIAPAASGIVSIFCGIGSDVINTQTIARTNIALVASERAYESLKHKTKEVLGEKKAQQVNNEIAKEKVDEARQQGVLTMDSFQNAPRSGNGTLYPFVDTYSMLPFWSNIDYIALTVKNLNIMMSELGARGDEYDFNGKIIGVPYSEWLKSLHFDTKIWNTTERKEHGWNKGYDRNGIDDDPIEYITHPIEWEPGFAVTAIEWEERPKDMTLGRLLKSSGM